MMQLKNIGKENGWAFLLIPEKVMMNELWLVSACLLGTNCKYNGGNNYNQNVIDFLKDKCYIAVCPEEAGGLPTPRIPCERNKDKVVTKEHTDVTKEFQLGAKKCFSSKATHALLKSKSPSCGKGKIYDGTFTKTLIDGNGIFAEMCLANNIIVMTEDDFI
jgi:purine nucleoside phosphorylase